MHFSKKTKELGNYIVSEFKYDLNSVVKNDEDKSYYDNIHLAFPIVYQYRIPSWKSPVNAA